MNEREQEQASRLLETAVVAPQEHHDKRMPLLLQLLAHFQYSKAAPGGDWTFKLIGSKKRLERDGDIKIVRLEGIDVSSYPDQLAPAVGLDILFQTRQLFDQGFHNNRSISVTQSYRILNFFAAVTQPVRDGVQQSLRPTVFEWATGDPKTEYTVFAMAAPTVEPQKARCYSLSELLGMRNSLSVVICCISRMPQPSSTATILFIPQEAFDSHKSFTCTTKNLMDAQKKYKTGMQANRRTDLSAYQSSSGDDLEHSTRNNHAHWQFRRRDSSDRSTQPYSAPSGLAAQQSENFQRFYRAVVSPTHVRVTAGGRIVPNTRAPPAFEWNGEHFVFEPRDSLQQMSSEHQVSGIPTMAGPRQGQIIEEAHPDVADATKKLESVTISDPSQFDHTKPFMIGGKWVYPAPQGFQPPPNAQPLPITMLGNPNFHQGHPGNPLGLIPAGQHHLPMMVPNGLHPHGHMMMLPHGAGVPPGYPPFPLMLANGSPAGFHGFENMHPPFGVPLVPLSELTKFQLQNLQAHLQNAEDHNLREELLKQIKYMEAMLATQLEHEGNVHERKRENSRAEHHGTGSSDAGSTISQTHPLRKTRLSATAAMAPPFKPRAKVVTTSFTQPITQDEFATVAETQEEIEARLLSKASGDWAQSSNQSLTAPPSLLKAHTMHAPILRGSTESQHPPSLHKAHTFHASRFRNSNDELFAPTLSPQGVPYLVGALPEGMQASEAQASDLKYPRELTEEELRARYLYWGKAPRSVQKGLPKFDGKDFYPPSPVKEMTRLATRSSIALGQFVPTLESKTPDFASLFTEDTVTGQHTPARKTSLQLTSPTRLFLDDTIIGYKSPSPRPSRYRYDASVNPLLSTFTSPVRSDVKHAEPLKVSANSQIKISDKGPTSVEDDDNETPGDEDETGTLDSWGAPADPDRWVTTATGNAVSSQNLAGESESNSSTVEFILGGQKQENSPVRGTFAERIANLSNPAQQNKFLHNMLKKTTAQTAPALSGTVSAMNAQGYLPQYRGSAAASLAPVEAKVSGVLPLKATNFTPENRPLNRDRSPVPIRATPEAMGAENYMRYISAKAEADKQVVERGWNAETDGTGPILGSEW